MHVLLNVPVSYAGILSLIIAGNTIISSLFSDRLNQRLTTGKVTTISVFMTALALLGFSFSSRFWQLCLWAIPYGLGAGSVDAALNNYVAIHYKARHMSWLHSFWGLGATGGSFLIAFFLKQGKTWTAGYRSIGIFQVVLSLFLFLAIGLWKNNRPTEEKQARQEPRKKLSSLPLVLFCFFCYCALESTTGLWAASYMVLARSYVVEEAAQLSALFYLGITLGRIASGFLTFKLNGNSMIRLGFLFLGLGILLVAFNLQNAFGLLLIGIGCAPIYPSMLHLTPKRFGQGQSQRVMGMQMATAYIGSTGIPPIFGLLAQKGFIRSFPFFIAFFLLGMILSNGIINKRLQAPLAS